MAQGFDIVKISGSNNAELVEATDHALKVRELSEFHQAALNGDAYAFFASYDITAADTLLYVCNNDAQKELCIEKMFFSSDVVTSIEVGCHVTSGTPTGNAVVPTNLNRRSAKLANATCISDQTEAHALLNVLTVSTGVGTPIQVDVGGAIVLGLNDCISVDVIAETGVASATIWGYFRDVA